MSKSQALIEKQAPCVDRCIAALIDGVIWYCTCPFLAGLTYYGLRDGFKGQSVGKRVMGLRVVKLSSGEPASFWDSMKRNMCDLWVGCCPAILFITKGRRRFGDLIAETIVIKDQ